MPQSTTESYFTTAINWVSDAVQQVTSADAFYEMLRYTPNYVPRAIARKVWGDYQEQTAWADTRSRMDPDIPLYRRFFSDIKSDTTNPYNVKIRGFQWSEAKGEFVERYTVEGFSRRPSMNEIEDRFRAGVKYHEKFDPEVEFDFDVAFLYHNDKYTW